jgi:hypothetical protein
VEPVTRAVAYRIYWRDTWTNDWQHQQTVGDVTQFTFSKFRSMTSFLASRRLVRMVTRA